MTKEHKFFASDNYAGVHPEILQALQKVNVGHAPAYGNDAHTQTAVDMFKRILAREVDVYFVYSGTGANILALDSVTQPFQSVIAAESAHIVNDECGAIEKITGSRIVTVPTQNGKLTPEAVQPHLKRFGDEHHAQVRVISISQTTEYGTVYTPQEIRSLASLAHQHDLLLHVDGARISNAAATLGCDFRSLLCDTGVDVISFGGTKNGMMFGEAVVFMNPELSKHAKFLRKQDGQLASKNRFIAAQFLAMYESDLWLKCASHANAMAQRLADKITHANGVQITQKVESNVVFAKLSESRINALRNRFGFYTWNENTHEVRWMTAFDTPEQDIDAFAAAICAS